MYLDRFSCLHPKSVSRSLPKAIQPPRSCRIFRRNCLPCSYLFMIDKLVVMPWSLYLVRYARQSLCTTPIAGRSLASKKAKTEDFSEKSYSYVLYHTIGRFQARTGFQDAFEQNTNKIAIGLAFDDPFHSYICYDLKDRTLYLIT